MTLNRQSNILAGLATIAVAAVIAITSYSVIEIRRESEQIAMAENTAKGVTHFRYLIMETALYHERRSAEQWRQRVASFRDLLTMHRYGDPVENALLEKERDDLEIIARLYERLAGTGSASIAAPPHADTASIELTAGTVSALFLTTQDMIDNAFELVRLNRLDLEAAQSRAERFMLFSILALASLIAAGCVIIKRRVLVPIASIQKGMEQVIKGDLSSRLNLAEANEIGVLAGTFDNMAGQLARSHAAITAENSERRLAQTALQETIQQLAGKSIELTAIQEELQTIIDHVPALVVYWDRQLLNRFANKAYLEWFGKTPQQMRGRHIREVIGEDRFKEIKPRMLSALQGNTEVFERTIRYASGQDRHALFTYIPDIEDEDGQVKGLYGFISDITPLRQAQAAQAEALAQLQSTVNAASEFAIIATDLDGIISMFSVGAEKMLGYLAEEIVGKTTPMILHLPDEMISRAAELTAEFKRPIEGFDVFVERVRQGGAETREWTYIRKDGSRLPIELTATPVFSEDKKITGYLGIAKDISQEKKRTEELRAATVRAESASRAKSEFVANMSHELRTPMNAVLGMAHLLGNTDVSIEQKRYLDMILASGQSLLGILNDILDFSKIEAGQMQLSPTPFLLGDLLAALATTMSVSAGDKDLELAIGVEPGVPHQLVGDMMRLQQVLLNLIGNAIKFTEQGEVSLLVESVAPLSGAAGDPARLRFCVRDTGIGMNSEQQSRLFTAFTQADSSMTRRFGGTGLGLAISRRLVDLLNGTITVRSELGRGSEFCVTIPLMREFKETPENIPADMRILVVEDNQTSRDYLGKAMRAWNCRVDSAASGTQAIELFKAAQAKNAVYDAVLVDWKMPGMDGFATAEAIRKLDPPSTMPIILMTNAFGRSKLMELEMPAPPDAVLIKPVTVFSIAHAMQEILTARADGKQIDSHDEEARPECHRLDGVRMLLVEDNAMNQIVARGMLELAGATVDIAENGKIAIDLLRQAPDRYALVLMDVQMPVMDGFTATRLIRDDLGLTVPILAMTAGVTETERLQCIDAGMDDFIAKPIEVDQLFASINRHRVASQACPPSPDGHAPPENGDASDKDISSVFNPDRLLAHLAGNSAYRNTLIGVLKKVVERGIRPVVEARLAWVEGRPAEAAQIFHGLRGTIGTLGAKRFSDASLEMETAILEQKIERIEPLFQLLEKELAETVSLARKWLRQQDAPNIADKDSPDPDMTQIIRLRALLSEKNVDACDLYIRLRPGLLEHMKKLDIGALDRAMDTLDFTTAIQCLNLLESDEK